jgi:hypothetical protein
VPLKKVYKFGLYKSTKEVSRSGLKGKSTEKFNKSENVSLTSLGPTEIEKPGTQEVKNSQGGKVLGTKVSIPVEAASQSRTRFSVECFCKDNSIR